MSEFSFETDENGEEGTKDKTLADETNTASISSSSLINIYYVKALFVLFGLINRKGITCSQQMVFG